MPISASLGIAAAGSIFKGIKSLTQRHAANKLKQSDYDFMPPGLLANQALDQQQAYSRQAPGASLANQQIQRAQANTIAAGQRMYGGDTNKMGAIAAQAQGGATDAYGQQAARGQQFSEGAFGRLRNDNSAIGQQQRQNYNDYWDAKSKLLYASDQNAYGAINDFSKLGQSAVGGGGNNAYGGIYGPNGGYNQIDGGGSPYGSPPGMRTPWGNPNYGTPYTSGYANS